MPRIQSAIKRSRQSEVRQERLKPYKTHMKTMVRKVMDAVKEGKKDDAQKALPVAFKAVDTAAKKNIIHRNTASRKKSLLSRVVAGMK